ETFVAPLIAIVALLAVLRVLAVAQAFLTAPGRRRWPKVERAIVAALVLSLTATHLVAIGGAWAVYRTGVAMNSNNMLSDSSLAGGSLSATSTATTPSATPSATPTPTPEAYASLPPWAFAWSTATPAPTYPSNPDRITFLLIGVDLMTGRSHTLTDSMILATLDVRTNQATLISVPRDTGNFALYYGGAVSGGFKLNELMESASSPSFGSPDSGIETLANEIGFLVGLPVDYYAAVDLEAFVQIVQAMGGVDINVTTPVNDPFTGTFVPAGLVHMDGHLALKYARSRMSTSDYARSSRQQDVLTALAHKVASPEVVPQLPELLSLAGTTIATDFPMSYARNFVSAFRRVGTPTQCVLGPPYSYHPDSSTTGGNWTSRLDLDRVAALSVYLFGRESRYYGIPGLVPAPCAS
ncbi:MAG: LCP family protein, partial [Candidatus Limnocylindrales bacterium]